MLQRLPVLVCLWLVHIGPNCKGKSKNSHAESSQSQLAKLGHISNQPQRWNDSFLNGASDHLLLVPTITDPVDTEINRN